MSTPRTVRVGRTGTVYVDSIGGTDILGFVDQYDRERRKPSQRWRAIRPGGAVVGFGWQRQAAVDVLVVHVYGGLS